jgi:hypothetical protein
VTTLRALLYADLRSSINQIKSIRRSPGRALMWLVFVLVIAAGIALRIARAVSPHRHLYGFLPARTTVDVIAGLTIVGIGSTLTHGSRMAGLFAHPAEARFIIGSPATPFIATLYVQLRDILIGGARRGLAVIYGALVYLPDGLRPGGFVRDLILVLLGFSAVAALPLARQLLAKPFVPLAVAVGWTVVAFGAVPLVRVLARALDLAPPADRLANLLPAWDPGRLLLAGPGSQSLAIGALFAGLAALFVFVARRARDAYPELYELSMKRMQRTERLRGRMFGSFGAVQPAARPPVVASSAAPSAPAGVLIFVWRAWTEYRRTNSARSSGIETALLLAGGYAVGRFASGGHAASVLPIATSLSTVLFLYALARAASLAVELRRPIFWLSDATLFERLCGLALAHAWRMIAWFVLIAVGLAAGNANPATIAASAFGGTSAILLAIAVGFASYAVLPQEIDQRGPLTFARWFIGYALALPPLGAGIMLAALGCTAVLSIAGGSIIAVLEAAVLIGFASWRLDRISILLR